MEYKSDIKQKDNVQEALANAEAAKMVKEIENFYNKIKGDDSTIGAKEYLDFEEKLLKEFSAYEKDKDHFKNIVLKMREKLNPDEMKILNSVLHSGCFRILSDRDFLENAPEFKFCPNYSVQFDDDIDDPVDDPVEEFVSRDIVSIGLDISPNELEERVKGESGKLGFDAMKIKEIKERVNEFKTLFGKIYSSNLKEKDNIKEMKKIEKILDWDSDSKLKNFRDLEENSGLPIKEIFKNEERKDRILNKLIESYSKFCESPAYAKLASRLNPGKNSDFFESGERKRAPNEIISGAIRGIYNGMANRYGLQSKTDDYTNSLKKWKSEFKHLKDAVGKDLMKAVGKEDLELIKSIKSMKPLYVDASNMEFDTAGATASVEKEEGNKRLEGYWKKADGMRFWSKNSPSSEDIKQGKIGDCYLLSSIRCLLSKDPEIIRNIFPNLDKEVDPDGALKGNTITVRLHRVFVDFNNRIMKPELFSNQIRSHIRQKGSHVDIKLNTNILDNYVREIDSNGARRIENRRIANENENYIWVNMIEKAVAVARSLNVKLFDNEEWDKKANSSGIVEWDNLESGESYNACMSILSGMESITYYANNGSCRGDKNVIGYLKEKEKCIIYCSMDPRFEPRLFGREIADNQLHAYTFAGFDENDNIILKNPWDRNEDTKMSVDDFLKNLTGITKLRVDENYISFPGIEF